MPIEIQIFYHTMNSVATVLYYLYQIFFLSDVVDHKKQIAKTILVYALVYFLTTFLTEISTSILLRASIEMFCFIMLYRLLLSKKTAVVALYVIYYWFFCIILQETIIVFLCKIYNINPWVDVGHGVQLGKVRVIFISSFSAIVLMFVLKSVLKSMIEVINEKSTWFLVLAAYILFCLDNVLRDVFFQYVDGGYLLIGMILIVGIAVVGIILHISFIRALYLERKQREERFKMEALEQQFAYYRDKQKDEEQVRSVYHDMKNHLLLLEHQIHSPETAKMVERLQREVESYADYVHTGNDFLDVIIKDKTKMAREKHIEFSAAVDLHGMDFIEPLDISTIFGNGIDNAMEACETLPEGQRVIVVKVGRVQNFLSILMENNCQEENRKNTKHTSKKDKLLHGFGISNMKNAADKYGGQLVTTREAGKFTLKIMLPIPRAVDRRQGRGLWS